MLIINVLHIYYAYKLMCYYCNYADDNVVKNQNFHRKRKEIQIQNLQNVSRLLLIKFKFDISNIFEFDI